MLRSQFLKTIIAAAALAAAGSAFAQAWPNKPVRFVLGAPAGTGLLGHDALPIWSAPVSARDWS